MGGSCGRLPSQPLAQLPSALAQGPAMLLLCVQDCAASGCMAQALATLEQHASSRGLRQAFAYIPSSPVQVGTLTLCLISRPGGDAGSASAHAQRAHGCWGRSSLLMHLGTLCIWAVGLVKSLSMRQAECVYSMRKGDPVSQMIVVATAAWVWLADPHESGCAPGRWSWPVRLQA